MSTIIYCDRDECQSNNQDSRIYPIGSDIAKKIEKKGWIFSKYDAHFCKDCIDEYFNEEDEQLIIISDYKIGLGKDFNV